MNLNCSPVTGADLIFPGKRAELVFDKFCSGDINWVVLEGPFGTGKSEAAYAWFRSRIPDIQNFDIQRLHADRVEGMREAFDVVQNIGANREGVRCLIIDECDEFSGKAAKDVKKELDRVVKFSIPIIMTTNNVQDLDGSIISRFTVVNWGKPSDAALLARVTTVLAANGRSMPESEILKCIRLAQNEPRKLFTEVLPLAL